MTTDTSNLNNTAIKSSFINFLDNKSISQPKNTKNLEKILENTNEILKIFIEHNLIDKCDEKKEPSINFSHYSEIGLPLYVIHFIKCCNKEKIFFKNDITLTTYDNLCKEKDYKTCRIAGHVILMWKKVKENLYAILSIIPNDIDELNFNQTRYFVTSVDINNINSWQKFNTIYHVGLYHEHKLKSFKEAIRIMVSY